MFLFQSGTAISTWSRILGAKNICRPAIADKINKLLVVDLPINICVHLLDQLLHKVVLRFCFHWEEEACNYVHLQRCDETISILQKNYTSWCHKEFLSELTRTSGDVSMYYIHDMGTVLYEAHLHDQKFWTQQKRQSHQYLGRWSQQWKQSLLGIHHFQIQFGRSGPHQTF